MINIDSAGFRGWSTATRWGIIAAVCVVAVILAALVAPIAQPQEYHHFADQRVLAGIPHALDVLSNLVFMLAGLLGLFFVLRAGITLDAGTRWAFATLFGGLVLTTLDRPTTILRRTISAWSLTACR